MASVSSHWPVVSGACRGWPGRRIASGVTTMRGGVADAGDAAGAAGAADAGADVTEVTGVVRAAADATAREGAGDARAADASPAAARAVMQAKLLGLYIE